MQRTYDIVIEHNNNKTFIMSARVTSTPKGEGYIVKDNIVYPVYFHSLRLI